MHERKKIAIYIDYSLRTPSFNKSYTLFHNSLFDKKEDDDIPLNNFWKSEVENNQDIYDFYFKQKLDEKDDYSYRNTNLADYFYNEEHYKKFLEEYTFNLYADCDSPSNRDIQFLNIAQSYLFDVILIDEYIFPRKKLNTFYFLSKHRIMPQAVLFLGPGQEITESSYYGIWNPRKDLNQMNGNDFGEFEMWLKELESKDKETINDNEN